MREMGSQAHSPVARRPLPPPPPVRPRCRRRAPRAAAAAVAAAAGAARSDGRPSENELELVIQSARLGEVIDDGSRCYAVFNWAIPSGNPTSARTETADKGRAPKRSTAPSSASSAGSTRPKPSSRGDGRRPAVGGGRRLRQVLRRRGRAVGPGRLQAERARLERPVGLRAADARPRDGRPHPGRIHQACLPPAMAHRLHAAEGRTAVTRRARVRGFGRRRRRRRRRRRGEAARRSSRGRRHGLRQRDRVGERARRRVVGLAERRAVLGQGKLVPLSFGDRAQALQFRKEMIELQVETGQLTAPAYVGSCARRPPASAPRH